MDLKNNNLLACEKHIDMIIDEFINDNTTFPEVTYNEKEKCSCCGEKSKYEVK